MTTPDPGPDLGPDPGPDLGPGHADPAAGELALGLLEGEERAAAVRRMLADAAFAREVARWRAHFGPLFAEAPEVAPPASLEARVLAAVGGAPARDTAVTLRRWRAVAATATAVAATLAGVLVLRPAPPAPAPVAPAPLVAVITPKEGAPFTAVYDPGAHQVRTAGGVAVPRGRDAELWAIGGDGTPRALGLLGRGVNVRVAVRGVAVGPGTTLAISIEPLGGAPGALPTGPVVATGTLLRI